MQSKLIKHGAAAINPIKRGVDILANAVKVTLGPKGRHVAVENPFSNYPTVTKDGVSVAKEITLEDPIENIGAQLVKEVAQRTADTSGDGTTTATLLAQAIFNEGIKAITAGANSTFVKRGIDAAVVHAVSFIRSQSIDVNAEKLQSVAKISANNDDILGTLIADAMQEAGEDGVITVEESKSFETRVESVSGMELARGYLSPYFINTEKLTCDLEKVKILITDKIITTHALLMPIMEKCAKSAEPLLVIAAGVDGTALSMMALNAIKGQVRCCAIKAPGYGDNQAEMLADVAALTGGTVISATLGLDLEQVTFHDLGTAGRIIIGKDTCTIIDGAGDPEKVRQRISLAKERLEVTQSDFDKEKTQERLAKLTGGVIVLHIGAPTETAMKERKSRVEDALHATRAAVEEGIVPGGGIAYISAAANLSTLEVPEDANSEDFRAGIKIVEKALRSPFYQICKNAGESGEVHFAKVTESKVPNCGYDIISGKYGDMVAFGIIDPTKVTINALENAASVAGILLTLDAVIVNKPEDIPESARVPAVPSMGMPPMM